MQLECRKAQICSPVAVIIARHPHGGMTGHAVGMHLMLATHRCNICLVHYCSCIQRKHLSPFTCTALSPFACCRLEFTWCSRCTHVSPVTCSLSAVACPTSSKVLSPIADLTDIRPTVSHSVTQTVASNGIALICTTLKSNLGVVLHHCQFTVFTAVRSSMLIRVAASAVAAQSHRLS
jgi:hypothetical protein